MLIPDEKALSFGLPSVDNVFKGFKKGDFAVLHGCPFCKTLSFLLAVRCQLSKDEGGLDSTAVYVDGGNSFNPYAISSIAREFNQDPRSILGRIFVSRAFTAYQLSALILETLETALKRHRSKLVLVSDLVSLFLDRDVPAKEAVDIFNKVVVFISELVKKRDVIVVVSVLPSESSRRRAFLESVLFGKASVAIKVDDFKGNLQFALEKHPFLQPFTVDILPRAVTLEKFLEM